jgi:Ca2+-transporting ATPase
VPTTFASGLSSTEAARRGAAEGRNVIPRADRPAWWRSVVGQLRDAVVLVLLAAGTLTALTGDWADTAVILAVVVVNTAIGAGQEVRAGRAVAALAELTAPRAVVVRDGRPTELDARDVVTGDLVRLAAGDIVAADAALEHAVALQVDESMLTGESVPVAKAAGDTVYAGTVVTRGRGTATVTSVGAASALGRLAGSVLAARVVRTPLQQQLAVLGRRLAVAASVAALAVALLNLAGGRSLETSLVLAVSLAVAAIPESLPAVVSLSLALAARRMSRRGVLVRKLAAVEALGSITVLAMDKTGTLTEGRMTADVLREELPADGTPSLGEALVLCNDAPAAGASSAADPTEVALVRAAAAAGVDVAATRSAWPRVAEVPFDAATARMTTVHASPAGHQVSVCKGAPEAVFALLDGDAAEAHAAASRLAADGRRVLAVTARVEPQTRWRLIGLAGLSDPPRATAAATVAAFKAAGVRPVMITGDHPQTAGAVARAVGVDGADAVHARVRPEDKSGIVTRLQQSGEVVAMTGDGVNDAPALRAADVGVAMGRRGTEVAKQAADLVLADDELSAMVPAIAEGRRVYGNLKRFLRYGLTGGVAEVLVMLLGPAVGLAVPLRAGQILWMNLLTHGLPGVAMGGEPAAADVLVRAPRSPRAQLLDRRLAVQVGVLGALFAAVALGVGAWAHHAERPAQSFVFLALTFAQLALAVTLRPAGTRPNQNPLLWGSVLLNAGLAVAAVRWAPLRELLRTAPVGWDGIGLCLAVGVGVAVLARLHAGRTRPGRTRRLRI